MKNSIILAGVISAALATFITSNAKTPGVEDNIGAAISLMNALKQSSAFAYSELIPSVSELHGLMKDNEGLYGPYVQEAGQELTNDYIHNFLPAVEKSFDDVLEQGARRGIEWSKIQFVNYETDGSEAQSPTYFAITFSSNGKNFQIRIENAFFVNGQFRANQHIRLI